MTANLDQAMLEALYSVATPLEINRLIGLLDEMSHGHVEPWFIDFIAEIIKRLAQLNAEQKGVV